MQTLLRSFDEDRRLIPGTKSLRCIIWWGVEIRDMSREIARVMIGSIGSRTALRAWALTAWLGLAAIGVPPGPSPAGAAEAVQLNPVAQGIYVYTGPHDDASDRNLGAVGNVGVVIGGESVALIDSGGSLAFGRRLRAALDEITDLPVSHVINTHVHPDHVLGNGAFAGSTVEFVGHRRLGAALAARGTFYLEAGARNVGPEFAGTTVIGPTLEVADSIHINLGGRVLRVTAHATAHTDNDLTVFDRRTRTLFAGDLVFVERLPIVDGSLKGWLTVMDNLRAVPAVRVVPGHGPASVRWPSALHAQDRYLRAVLRDVRIEIAAGGTIENAIGWVASEERTKWARFAEDHPRNVTASFTELEWE